VCHRTVSGAPKDSNSNLPPSGISRGTHAIIHQTVRCTPGSVRCAKEERPQELACFGKLQRLVRYNSPDMSGVHRTVRCTKGLRLKLFAFGNSRKPARYNSPDCPVCTGHVRCSKEARPPELASLGFAWQPLRYNSPDCPVCTGLSGVPAEQRLSSAPTAPCGAFNARAARADGRHAHTGAPDIKQYMSGVHRTPRRAHKSEAPTVRIQRQ
jgi:hypothetical protein